MINSIENVNQYAQALQQHKALLSQKSIKELFSNNRNQSDSYFVEAGGLLLDYSKNKITSETLQLLTQLASACNLSQAITDLFSGSKCVNQSENRAALHPALRAPYEILKVRCGTQLTEKIQQTWDHVECLSNRVHHGMFKGFSGQTITDIVHIGIGGSNLGPRLLYQALKPFRCKAINCHFISNYDDGLDELLRLLSPETTLIVLCSKSFRSPETQHHANRSLTWLGSVGGAAAIAKQCIAITANTDATAALGISKEHTIKLMEWVGGRYSISSAISFSVICTIGIKRFREFLDGAYAMDQHFENAPFTKNLPVVKALLAVWYTNFFDHQSMAIVPYTSKLKTLPSYLQQLFMESLGKSVQQDGTPVQGKTGQIIWGGVGVDSQHSFHQLLLQGNQECAIDFIVPTKDSTTNEPAHNLLANCLATSSILINGNLQEIYPERKILGRVPNNTIVLESVSPKTLGALIACYEHQVYTQAVIWNINPFDQWGVEFGKKIAKSILEDLYSEKTTLPSQKSIRSLILGVEKYYE